MPIALACAAAFGAGTGDMALATMPESRSEISSSAYVSFVDPAGAAFAMQSNVVSAQVTGMGDLRLSPGQTRPVPRGATTAFVHTLTNTGNVPASFDLDIVPVTGLPMASAILRIDLNCDAVPDESVSAVLGGTAPLWRITTPVLRPGETVCYIINAEVPDTLTAGGKAGVTLMARSNPGDAAASGYTPAPQASVSDYAEVIDEPQVEISQRLSRVSGPSPENGIKLTISVTNRGTQAARNVVVSSVIGLDSNVRPFEAILGQGASPLPYDTTGFRYVPGSARWSASSAPLTDVVDGDEGGVAFHFDQAALTGTFVFDTLPPGAQGELSFDVDVLPNLPPDTGRTLARSGVAYGAQKRHLDISNPSIYQPTADPDAQGAAIDLVIAKAFDSTTMVAGKTSSYLLQVTNQGALGTTGLVTVSETLPAGVRLVSMDGASGPDWMCNGDGAWQTGEKVICVTARPLPGGGLARPLRLRVEPVSGAFASLPVTLGSSAEVAGGGEQPAQSANNRSETVQTTVLGPSSAAGRVWHDASPDFRFGADDTGLKDWTVTVCALDAGEQAEAIASGRREDPRRGWMQATPAATAPTAPCTPGQAVATARTDANGQYRIDALAPGLYKLQFRDASGQVVGPPVNTGNAGSLAFQHPLGAHLVLDTRSLTSGQALDGLDLPYQPTGRVYDSITRKPLAGARLRLVGPAGFDPARHLIGGALAVEIITATSSAGVDGAYQFVLTGDYPPGEYRIQVTSPAGYLPEESKLWPGRKGALSCGVDPDLCAIAGLGTGQAEPPPPGTTPQYFVSWMLQGGERRIIGNHIPIDPVGGAPYGLMLSKKALRNEAEIGEFVDYVLEFRNSAPIPQDQVVLDDVMPFGFTFMRGSARLDGVPVTPELTGTSGLRFRIGQIPTNGRRVLTYRLRVDAGAQRGDGINHAQMRAPNTVSNRSSARVRVMPGVFSDRGFIVGTVFGDCNGDGRLGPGEQGIAGARVVMEDGSYAITDASGRFSLYNVAPRTHVLRLDDFTLPPGVRALRLDQRNAGVATSRFADLRNGELHRADFAVSCQAPPASPSAPGLSTAAGRPPGNPPDMTGAEPAAAGQGAPARIADIGPAGSAATAAPAAPAARPLLDAAQWIGQPLPTVINRSGGDVRANAPSGVINGKPGGVAAAPQNAYRPPGAGATPNPANSNVPGPVAQTAALKVSLADVPLEQLTATLRDNTLAFLNLRDGDVLPMAQTHVRLKTVAGTRTVLRINGQTVPDSRVGKRSVMAEAQLEALEYIGLDLKPGRNLIEASQVDPFGIERATATLNVMAPDGFSRILVEPPASAAVGDGRTPVRLKIRLTDAAGVPVTARTPVTIEARSGRLQMPDRNDAQPGVQAFVEGGGLLLTLLPPLGAIDEEIRVTSGVIQGELRFRYTPELRPMMAVGLIEGALNLRNLDLSRVRTDVRNDAFEREIRSLRRCLPDDRSCVAGRAALYLKGKVRGDYLLTLAYDSDKEVQARLFRDIRPDEHYPIYGDASTRGFDAQSTGALFVKLESASGHVMLGDFVTGTQHPGRKLSQYNRALNGLALRHESARARFHAFASYDSLRQISEELPANGTSGPFQLQRTGGRYLVSERVSVVTFDRNQPDVVLTSQTLSRLADYEIEAGSGRILLKAPLPSFDANLNRNVLRVVYEIDQGGEKFFVAGADAQVRVNERVELGAAVVRDINPTAPATLRAAHATLQLAQDSFLTAEIAETRRGGDLLGSGIDDTAHSGRAGRVEVLARTASLEGRAFIGRTDPGFNNPNSVINRGRGEAGAKLTWKIGENRVLGIEALATEDRISGAWRAGAIVGISSRIADGVQAEFSLRASRDALAVGSNGQGQSAVTTGSIPLTPGTPGHTTDITSIRARLTAQIPHAPQASVFLETEQALDSAARNLGGGLQYQLGDKGRVYARHNFIHGIRSPWALTSVQSAQSTVIGVESNYRPGATAHSEYRVREGLNGREAEAALGLRNTVPLSGGVNLQTSFERISGLSGAALTSTAGSVGLEFNPGEDFRAAVRVEGRSASTQDGWLVTGSAARRLAQDWLVLLRGTSEHLARRDGSGSEASRGRLQAGVAYRAEAVNALGKVEWIRERDTNPNLPLERSVVMLSQHVNVQPGRGTSVAAQVAAKLARDRSNGLDSSGSALLLAGRVTRDLAENFDVGIVSSIMLSPGAKREYGVGVEFGYMVSQDVWLSAGYNFRGFHDRDFASLAQTERGVLLRLRMKFDESMLGWRR